MTDTINITLEIPADLKLGTKANGKFVAVDVEKAHNTWLVEFLRYGIQRKLNDQFAGEKGQEKLDRVREEVRAINGGEERAITIRRTAGSTIDPVTKLARNAARDVLTMAFKQATGLAKLADMCAANEKIAQYFVVDGDKATWKPEALDKFIESKPGGRDFKAEAKATLEMDAALLDL